MLKKKGQAKSRYRMTAWHSFAGRQIEKKYFSLQASDDEAKEWFHNRLKVDRTIHEARLEAVKGNRHITDYIGYV